MSSSWLRDYMLEGLGFEIRKASTRTNETTAAMTTAMTMGTTAGQARLVQILDRGQGRLESNTNGDRNSRNTNSTRVSPCSNWWNLNRRGESPNLARHTNAWILVSDGSHSARLYLTIEALREIFDRDNQNNNEDNLFGRGCCVLLKTYCFDYGVDNNSPISANEENTNDHRHSLEQMHHGYSVHLKVSSLEPKPGFNYHHGTNTNHSNHNNSSSETIIRPVLQEADVLYGLQFLARQRQQQMRNISSSSTMSSACIARDWDIAFGCLSKGRLTISTTTAEVTEAVVDGNLDEILELVEEAASTDDATREWEMAKKEYGIISTNNDNIFQKNQKPMTTTTNKQINEQVEDVEDNDQDNEGLSQMYIQNILATSDEGEDESKNEKSPLSQKEYEDDDADNLSSSTEGALLPETQPKILMTTTESDCATSIQTGIIGTPSRPSTTVGITSVTGVETPGESKTVTLKSKRANDDDDHGILSGTVLQIQPAKEMEKESDETSAEPTTKMKRKRPRANSFESGIASNLTLDEAIIGPVSTRKSGNHMRRRQQQQKLMLHQQQGHLQNSTGIWESIKEQLFEPGRTILYCVPSCRMPSGSDSNDNEKMLITPKRALTSATSNVKNLGSAASFGSNFTSLTPNPSSGAYYKKYGLARWLSQNTSDEERG